MKLVVFGANGPTGLELVKQALERGHQVTAVARNPSTVSLPAHPGLTVVPGQPMEAGSVEEVTAGHEVILSAIGSRSTRPTTVYSLPGRNMLRAMERHGIRRLVCTTSAGVESDDPTFGFFYKHVLKRFVLKNAYEDCKRLEALLRESPREWVVVRPTELTDGARTGRYRVSPRYAPSSPRPRISRADLAHFMLEQLSDAQHVHKTPTLAY